MAIRLGTETASVMNHLLSGTNGQPAPAVGMGITILHWTDRSAGTIHKVSPSGKTFWFTEDKATRIDGNGMSESQNYRYEPQPDAPLRMARQRVNGQWRVSGDGKAIMLGNRAAYHDYSF